MFSQLSISSGTALDQEYPIYTSKWSWTYLPSLLKTVQFYLNLVTTNALRLSKLDGSGLHFFDFLRVHGALKYAFVTIYSQYWNIIYSSATVGLLTIFKYDISNCNVSHTSKIFLIYQIRFHDNTFKIV